ncbi:DegT/DnrJ/EryC1/StrS family aminotransferase [Bacillus cereus]|uniref:DegT/DnrJ/EryC1/StrS family aminotransferase n=1 Tax=Bacillus cereus TaxID=1396 RepID=UPI002EDACCC9
MIKKWPLITEGDKAKVLDVLDNGNLWRGDGKYLFELENKFSRLQNANYALATTNGTHAIEIALAALGIGYGDEVLIPAYTFIATASAVIMRNALPVPVEVDKDTYCIDPEKIEEMITERTKAIIPVHIAGHACDMNKIRNIAQKYNLHIIEDAAHSQGSTYKDLGLGSIGDFGTFSFQAIKTMTAGEGGMLITNNEELKNKAYSFFNCGRLPDGDPYDHVMICSNYRMSELQAALLVNQCDRILEQINEREEKVNLLNEMLAHIDYIKPQGRKAYATRQGYSMYMFRFDEKLAGISKEEFLHKMNKQGYGIRSTYPVFYKTTMFKKLYNEHKQFDMLENKVAYEEYRYANAEDISNNVLWLPHFFLNSTKKEFEDFKDSIYRIGRCLC